VSPRRLLAVGLWSCLGLTSSLGCVAQETYQPHPSSSGGSAGTRAGEGSAGLVIHDPSGGAGGVADASAGTSTSGGGGDDKAACQTSAQCALPFPYCSTSRGVCVECLSRSNCAGTGRNFCDLASNSCAACLTDENCAHAAPYCATALGACVECLSNDNCGADDLVCDRESYHCVKSCRGNSDCSGNAATPLCDPDRSLCVACLEDVDCSGETARCDPTTKVCVGCLADDDCAAPAPHCDKRGRTCVECVSNQDCKAGAVCAVGVCSQPK
jgi:hypothetical protein